MTWWKYIVFIVVTIAVYAGLLTWVWRRFVTLLPVGRRVKLTILGSLVGLYPFIYILRRFDREVRFDTVEGLMVALYTVMVFLLLLMTLILLRDGVWLILRGVDRLLVRMNRPPVLPSDPDRRRRLLGISSVGIAALAAGLLVLGIVQALSAPEVNEVTVTDPRLPPQWSGLRIVVVGDLHVGPTLRREAVVRLVDRVRAVPADFVVIVGDLVDGPWSAVGPMLEPLRQLGRPVYFVSGNHELYWKFPAWRPQLEALGITVLSETHVTLEKSGAKLLLGGIPDRFRWSGGPQPRDDGPRRSLVDAPPADYRILLAHRPTTAPAAQEAGYDLMLSGHTHGGQFFPFTLVSRLMPGGGWGLFRHQDLIYYVTKGAGFWGPPVRLFHRPEIVVLTLRR